MVDETEVREQFIEEFDDSIYPVQGPTGLLPALSQGPMTTFEIGEERLSAMELASELEGHEDFPYEDVDTLVDDVMTALDAEGWLTR